MRSRDGGVVELRNVVRTELGAAPSAITRHDRQRSVTISANLEGIRMEEASRVALAIGAEILPANVHDRAHRQRRADGGELRAGRDRDRRSACS